MSKIIAEWEGSREEGILSGIGTFHAGGKSVALPLPNYASFHAMGEVIKAAQREALNSQAAYLRGAINHLLEHR